MKTVAEAVQHAHQRGVIHRDLKPSNILVTADGNPSVLDFGLAKSFLEDQAVSVFTMNGELAGTVPYMSPEQAAGRIDELDTRTDIYSLGVILYELLTGQLPHDLSCGPRERLRRIEEEEVIRPRQVTKEIDGELETLLLKALAQDPALRYPSAGDLARDIDNYLTGEPLIAKKPTTTYFLKKRLRRHRTAVAVALLVFLGVVGMGAFTYVRVRLERNRAVEAEKEAKEQEGIALAEAEVAKQAQAEADRQRIAAQQEEARAKESLAQFEAERAKANYELALSRTSPEHLGLYGGRPWVEARRLIHRGQASVDPMEMAVCYRRATTLLSEAVYEVVRSWSYECVRTLAGHEGPVASVAFSPDGKLALSTSYDEEVLKLWDVSTGKLVRTFMAAGAMLSSVAFSPDGHWALSGGNALKLWDIETGECVRTFSESGHWVQSVAFSPDGRFAVSGGQAPLKLWDIATGECLRMFAGQNDQVCSVAFSPDGLSVISGGKDLKLWSTSSGECVRELTGHGSRVNAVAFSPDGAHVLSAGDKLKLWNIVTGECVKTFKKRDDVPAFSVVFSPNGLWALSGSHQVNLWNISTGESVRTFTPPLA